MEINRHDPLDVFVDGALAALGDNTHRIEVTTMISTSREYAQGLQDLGRHGPVLICGSNLYDTQKEDRRKRYPNAIGVDMIEGEGVDIVANLEDRRVVNQIGPFNHVECISVLEHSRKPWLMAQNIKAMMLPGATILISVPFAWRRHAYPSDYWRFTIEGVKELFTGIKWVAECYCHGGTLDYKGKIPAIENDGVKFIARTEAFLFGVRG